jgi:hypothetical protein
MKDRASLEEGYQFKYDEHMKDKPKQSTSYFCEMIWVDKKVKNNENTMYSMCFKHMGFSNFKALETVEEL